jgi:glycerate kinase
VVLAPDKFKGSLTAAEVVEALSNGLRAAVPDVSVTRVPIADGGDGSLEVALARGYAALSVMAAGPLGDERQVTVARSGSHAIVELAEVCGLQQLPGGMPKPEQCTTLGLGYAVRAALDAGCTEITLAVGGSASTDGGAGLLVGLGARLLDDGGRTVQPVPADLPSVATVDLSGLDPRLQSADIRIAVDVRAPLLGPDGAARVFAPQKGADAESVQRLEAAMRHWAEVLQKACRHVDARRPGMGAAGGTAFAVPALGGRLVDGAETFLDLAGYDEELAGADLVITGEGRLDRQTLMGKAPAVIARKSAAAGIPCVAVVGSLTADVPNPLLHKHGFSAVHQLVDIHPAVATDPEMTRSALTALGERIAETLLPTQLTHTMR